MADYILSMYVCIYIYICVHRQIDIILCVLREAAAAAVAVVVFVVLVARQSCSRSSCELYPW